MKRKILLLLLAMQCLVSVSQNVFFKFGGGLSSHYGTAQAVGAFKLGVGYEIEFGQHWTFTPGFEVYGKGWQDPNEEAYAFDQDGNPVLDDEGNQMKGVINRSATQNYLEVPLLFSYYLRTGESRYVVFGAGPYLAYGVSGKQKTKGDTTRPGGERYYYERKTFKEPGTHRFDYGVQAFVGYQFPSSFTIGLEADFGVGKFNAAGARNISGLISLGYKL